MNQKELIASGTTWTDYLKTATEEDLHRANYYLNAIKDLVWKEIDKRRAVRKDKDCVEKYGDWVWVFEFEGKCNSTVGVTPNRVLECDCNFMMPGEAIMAIMARHPTAKIGHHELSVGTTRVWFEVEV